MQASQKCAVNHNGQVHTALIVETYVDGDLRLNLLDDKGFATAKQVIVAPIQIIEFFEA